MRVVSHEEMELKKRLEEAIELLESTDISAASELARVSLDTALIWIDEHFKRRAARGH